MKLDNICTVETRVHDPKLRALQCWYLPKLKRQPRPSGAKAEDAPRMFRIQRPSRFFARPEMWGAWNISTEVPSPRERERMTRRTLRDDRKNTQRFFHRNEDSISALRNMYKRGEKPRKEVHAAKVYIDHLKKRKQDIEAVLNLDALTHALKFFDGWDSSSMAPSSGGGCED
ncbi:hypothetical protein SELMODRAFT_423618 [Selaginella moellendorffii]|uniref:Uncharacterized protein n=1 Tax=Selaginella moellendorffii TaxID=88036 RepID=D8SM97_SELML|nr:hypothetical protein SELMODRAFT_423618 [Selaginella moellendorffii]